MSVTRWASIVALTKPEGDAVATSGENAEATSIQAECMQEVISGGDWAYCQWAGSVEVYADSSADSCLWKCPRCGAYNEASLLQEVPC